MNYQNRVEHLKNRVSGGFTIIELIVVIAIISFLAAIVLTNVNGFMAKARDAKRKGDIRQISVALEMNYAKHGAYTQPEACGSDNSYAGCDGNTTGDWGPNSDLRDLISDGSMSVLPKDPINNSSHYYSYEVTNLGELWLGSPAGAGYDLCAIGLEAGGNFCIRKRP